MQQLNKKTIRVGLHEYFNIKNKKSRKFILNRLKSKSMMNSTGFFKNCKKLRKILGASLRERAIWQARIGIPNK